MERDRAVTPADECQRRSGFPWLGGRRRPLTSCSDDDAHSAGPLNVSVSVDRFDTAIVTVTGRLIRQHADGLDRSLGSVFAADHPTFIIDLAGVTRLDPPTLAAITRRAAQARGRGALIRIVPPGAGSEQAA